MEENKNKTNTSTPTPIVEVKPISNTVEIPKITLDTKPSIPLKDAFPRVELGDSGTRGIRGIITEEYNPNLQGVQGIKVFDEMRKSDGTVRAAMLVTTLPIRRAKWFVNPAIAGDAQCEEQAQFIEHALFDWLDTSWDAFVRQALLSVAFGVMPFEKIYGIKEHEGKTYVTLDKLAPRLPKSIMQWELKDGTFGIQQIRQDGQLAQIPGSKLVIFVNEKEGNNWWGNAFLRPAYKHWYFKNNFYKIDAMSAERQGMGVPMINMPPGYTDSDEAQAKKALQNLRSNEDAFLLLPDGYKAEFMDMKASGVKNLEQSINHHNKEILLSVLAQFLELGASSGSSGSRALSTDHSDLFLKAEEAIANDFIATVNKDIVQELIDLNFDNVKVYPVLDYSGISRVDITSLGTAYSQLVTAGAITPTNDDQQYLRAAMGLPPRTQDDIDAEEEEPTMEEQEDHVDIEDDGEPDPKKPVDNAVDKAKQKTPTPVNNKKVSDGVDKVKKPVTAHEHSKKIKKFDDGKGFMSWRPLTFAEKKVTWKNIEDMMNTLQDEFTTGAQALLNESKDSFMKKLHAAMEAGNTKDISDLEINFVSDYKALLKSAMKDAYEYGKVNAAKEMGVDAPASTASSLAQIDLLASTIAQKAATDIETKAKVSTANALRNDTSTLQAVGAIDATLEESIAKSIENAGGLIIGQSMNIGRNDVFERNRGMIHGLQRSEVLDSVTCDFCLSMDGLVIEPDDKWASEGEFHNNCRGIWVEILKDEEDAPDITGIPNKIGDYYGGEPNSLIQPPKPIVTPGSLASKEIQSRN